MPRICLYSKWSKEYILIYFIHFHFRKTKLILMIKFEWIRINSECCASLFSRDPMLVFFFRSLCLFGFFLCCMASVVLVCESESIVWTCRILVSIWWRSSWYFIWKMVKCEKWQNWWEKTPPHQPTYGKVYYRRISHSKGQWMILHSVSMRMFEGNASQDRLICIP